IHAVAVVAALLPNLAEWAVTQIDNALTAAGTSAEKIGSDALGQAGVVYDGLKVLGSGAVLAGLVLGAIVTFILDKRFRAAGVAALIGAGLSWIGLIHAHSVEWAAAPGVALGYLLFAVVCLAYSLLPSPSTATPVADEVAV
ncbi:regulator, partial [Nocardia salmonicida]